VPFGLAAYEYGLALAADAGGDRVAAADLFGRALTYRPAGWPAVFYDRYRAVLAKTDAPALTSRPPQEPSVRLGRKDLPNWFEPMPSPNGAHLRGFTVDRQADIDRGLPISVSWSWERDREQWTVSASVTNLAPNGGFELGPLASVPLGWHASRESDARVQVADVDGGTSRVVILRGKGPGMVVATETALIALPPGSDRLLWSVRLSGGARANPHMFTVWFDGNRKLLSFDLPLQGRPPIETSRIAGIVGVPPKAAYVVLRLANWMTEGDAVFDDVILTPVPAIGRMR
jgi:hypothetical protein